MKKAISKKEIGTTICCIPTYNSVNRNIPLEEQLLEDKLIKITDKRFTLESNGTWIFNGLDADNNGYIPFKNKQEALNYIESQKVYAQLKQMYYHEFSVNQLLEIKKILALGV